MNRGNGGGFRGGARGGRGSSPRGGFHDGRGRGGGFRPRGGGGSGYRPDFRGRGFGGAPGRGGFDNWRGGDRGFNRGGGFRGRGIGMFPQGPRSSFPRARSDSFRKGNGHHYTKNAKNPEMGQRLCETDVGISEYISTHDGFNGVIKQRFSDFHVNEIDSDGNIVELTSLDVPTLNSHVNEDSPLLDDVLPKETVGKLRTILTDFGKGNVVDIDVTAMSKEERKKIHEAIRVEFGDKLNSNTKTIGEVKLLVICRSNRNAKQDVRLPWPEERAGKYTHFVMYKENLDTMEAVSFISSRFNMNPSSVSYSGTKDKRAMTSQKVAMFKVEPSRLVEKCKKQARITFGNFEFKPTPLQLGNLKGNRFRIALRNVTGDHEQIAQATSSLQTNGFINYYGLQRFGNSSEVPTYKIGKELLLGNWKKVCQLILQPRRNDPNLELNQARQVWWETGFASKAFHILHRQDCSIEGKLLSGLVKRGEANWMEALESIPRNTRLLYLHAYQSLVWNKVVSRRIKEFGLKPIVGDLVLEGEIQSEIFFDESPLDTDETAEEEKKSTPAEGAVEGDAIKKESVDGDTTEKAVEKDATEKAVENDATEKMAVDGDAVEKKAVDGDAVEKKAVEGVEVEKAVEAEKTETEDGGKTANNGKEVPDKPDAKGAVKVDELTLAGDKISVEVVSKRPPVKVLTEEDVDDYDITDIVLPLPGFDISFPENEVKEWYEEYLKEDGLSIAGMKQKIRKYSLGGAYRKMVLKPECFSSRIVRYSSPDKPLILSDLEILRGTPEPGDEEAGGDYRALILDFRLPASAYATMALRDVLKRDTSTSYQASLNSYHDKGKESLKRKEESVEDESPTKKQKLDHEVEVKPEAEEGDKKVEAVGDADEMDTGEVGTVKTEENEGVVAS